MADILGIYYLIRHKATQEIMPQMKKGRGYTHWNPGNKDAPELKGNAGIPRLIDTRRKAAACINQWVANPNASNDMDGDIQIKLDNRKKEDLEVVEVELVIKVEK
jgi:hypothetical protein